LVEFALLLPLFMMLVLGMLSGGQAYNKKLDLTNSAREGARYGSTLPQSQTGFTASTCDTSSPFTWAEAVRSVIVERSSELQCGDVCVALVSGSGASPAAVSADHTTAGSTNPCFVDNSSATGKRVQVSVQTTSKLEALVFSHDLTLKAKSIARFEDPS
jgi:Flp pilus assembly protein TadG